MTTDHQLAIEQLKIHLPRGSRLLLAISGGLDSSVLLDAVSRLQSELDLHIEVAHVDHGLRESSAADALFTEEAVARYKHPFHLHRASGDSAEGSIELWARNERYRYFSSLLAERGLDYTVTAHHADDRAETLLMRFLANREPSSIHAVDERRKILRPLLWVRRRNLERYALHHDIQFCTDPTNSDPVFLRNRYRHRIIPFIEEQLSTDLVGVLADRAESLEDDASALEQVARDSLEPLTSLTSGSKEWLRELNHLLRSQPLAVKWRMIERILAPVYGDYFGRRTALRVLEFIEGNALAVEIPGGHRIERRQGGVKFG